MSHPMRVCGLKQKKEDLITPIYVAPHAGVWIETRASDGNKVEGWSHPMRVCGLKQTLREFSGDKTLSHPMRVCGLKRVREM